jgi:hypothetical protein
MRNEMKGVVENSQNTYIALTLYPRRGSRDISVFLRDTHVLPKYVSYEKHCRHAVLLQSISGISAINPLVAFYDIHGGKREVLCFYFVPDTTRVTRFSEYLKKIVTMIADTPCSPFWRCCWSDASKPRPGRSPPPRTRSAPTCRPSCSTSAGTVGPSSSTILRSMAS